jgi:hypothetical protein
LKIKTIKQKQTQKPSKFISGSTAHGSLFHFQSFTIKFVSKHPQMPLFGLLWLFMNPENFIGHFFPPTNFSGWPILSIFSLRPMRITGP